MMKFPLLLNDTRLVRHCDTLFKVKVIYPEEHSCRNISVSSSEGHAELEGVLRAVLYMIGKKTELKPVLTKHFLVRPKLSPWSLSHKLIFSQDDQVLDAHPFLVELTVSKNPKLLADSTIENISNPSEIETVDSTSDEVHFKRGSDGRIKRMMPARLRGQGKTVASKEEEAEGSNKDNTSRNSERESSPAVPQNQDHALRFPDNRKRRSERLQNRNDSASDNGSPPRKQMKVNNLRPSQASARSRTPQEPVQTTSSQGQPKRASSTKRKRISPKKSSRLTRPKRKFKLYTARNSPTMRMHSKEKSKSPRTLPSVNVLEESRKVNAYVSPKVLHVQPLKLVNSVDRRYSLRERRSVTPHVINSANRSVPQHTRGASSSSRTGSRTSRRQQQMLMENEFRRVTKMNPVDISSIQPRDRYAIEQSERTETDKLRQLCQPSTSPIKSSPRKSSSLIAVVGSIVAPVKKFFNRKSR